MSHPIMTPTVFMGNWSRPVASTSHLQSGKTRAPSSAAVMDSAIPLDVGDPQVTIAPAMVNGKTVALVTVAAVIPNSPSFAGYQIYLKNYFGNPTLIEDAFIAFSGSVSTSKGTALSGQFYLEPDAPPPYQLGTVKLVVGSTTIAANVSTPPVVWNAAWTSRFIVVVDGLGNYTTRQISSVTPGAPPSLTVTWPESVSMRVRTVNA